MSDVGYGRLRTRALGLGLPAVVLLAVLSLFPAGLTLLLYALLVAALFVEGYRRDRWLVVVLSGAYLARLGLVFVDTRLGVLPTPPISGSHDLRAAELTTAWVSGQFLGIAPGWSHMETFVAHVLAPFYLVFGDAPVSGRLAIATVSLLLGYLVYRIALEAVDRRIALTAAAAVLLWPTVLYRSVVIQREVIVATALLAFLYATVRWLNRVTVANLLLAAGAVGTVFALRKENLVLVAILGGTLGLIRARERPYYLVATGLLSLPFVAYFALNFGSFTGFGSALTPEAIDAFAYGRAHGEAVYLLGLHYDTWFDVLRYIPLKTVYFLFTPFPWQIRGPVELVVGGSAMALLAATVAARRGLSRLRDHPLYLLLLLTYLVTGVVAYAIIEMNYGAAVRRRIQFLPVIILLATIGLSHIHVRVGEAER